jgi:signal transduction histidine kinase
LLSPVGVAKSRGIRHRLLTILLLGVIVSGLSLSALIHLLTTTTRQRVERARDAVAEEVDRLAQNPARLTESAPMSFVGMRGGILSDAGATSTPRLPKEWAASVDETRRRSEANRARTTLDVPLDESTLVVATHPTSDGKMAWSGYLVRQQPTLRTWQWIVMWLALATAGLVATTVYSIVTVQRGAAALRSALQALATDLSAPIPRPNVQELASVAEGVQRLADGLAAARREEERLQLELARQERLAALGRVVAGVAHEVRNPLASIKLRLDLAAAGTVALPKDVERAISHATLEIGRLDRLVADLLIVSGRATGPKEIASLGALVRARIEALSPWAAERHVSMTASGDVTAEVDVDSIARSLDNLLRNAVEASPEGDSVDIRVTSREDLVVVSVIDHGAGVTEPQPELFEPFFTTKPDGTGLGLALSRAIARAHGGDVSYGRKDGATCFELALRRTARVGAYPGRGIPAPRTGAFV